MWKMLPRDDVTWEVTMELCDYFIKTNLEDKVHVQDEVLISHELNNHINL